MRNIIAWFVVFCGKLLSWPSINKKTAEEVEQSKTFAGSEQMERIEAQLRYLNARLEQVSQTQEELMTAFLNQTMIYEEILGSLEQQTQNMTNHPGPKSERVEHGNGGAMLPTKDKKQILN